MWSLLQYWSDFKNKLKNKVWLLKRKKAGNSLKGVRPLTKMEKRVLAILGPYYEKKKSKDADSHSSFQNNMHPKVKLETFQETVHVNSFSKANNATRRLSGGEDDSDYSAESFEGEYTNDNDSNAPALQSIYPKWLIEVEKKRADAELIRAKAEEQRAVVASKTAEASLLQAEALRRLADAATTQAEAITRIAGILESRAQRNSMLDL